MPPPQPPHHLPPEIPRQRIFSRRTIPEFFLFSFCPNIIIERNRPLLLLLLLCWRVKRYDKRPLPGNGHRAYKKLGGKEHYFRFLLGEKNQFGLFFVVSGQLLDPKVGPEKSK